MDLEQIRHIKKSKPRTSQSLEIEERVMRHAKYMLEHKATIRETAAYFKVNKTTVHIDVATRLWGIAPIMAAQVRDLLDHNLLQRAARGGVATQQNWKSIKDAKKNQNNNEEAVQCVEK